MLSLSTGAPAYASLLTNDQVLSIYGDSDPRPTVVQDVDWQLTSSGTQLLLTTTGLGSLRSDLHMGDLRLPAATLTLNRADESVQGSATTWHAGALSLGRTGLYGASVQRFTGAGITAVALGQWKFVGDYQNASFSFFFDSGTRSARGTFLVGTPSTPEVAARLTSGRYTGYLSAGDDSGQWLSSYDQLTGKVSIDIDTVGHRITMRAYDGEGRGGNLSATNGLTLNPNSSASVFHLPQPVYCSGPMDAATGRFSCTFESHWSGTVQGQLYGAQGEQLGASFSVSPPDFNVSGRPVLVGGLVARRVLDGAPTGSGQTPPLSPQRLNFEQVVGVASPEVELTLQAGGLQPSALKVAVLDPQGQVAVHVPVSAGSTPDTLRLSVRAAGSTTLGQTSGELTLRACLDDPLVCRQPVLGSPWKLPYTATVLPVPGPNVVWVPSVLRLTAYEGLSVYADVQALIQQPALGNTGGSGTLPQYAYSVVNPGILEVFNAQGDWDNQTPGTFTQGVLRVAVPANVTIGLYEGDVVIDVLGIVGGRRDLPTAQPVVRLPYEVAVYGWTNLRSLSTPEALSQIPNGRGNADARRSLPMALDPARFLVRWRAPLPTNFGAVMPVLGDGFVAGVRREDGLYILTVLDEATGQQRWETSWPAGEPGEAEPVVTASNGSLQVRRAVGGGFQLTVYNPVNGSPRLQRSCSTCQVVWAQEYGRGWAARIMNTQDGRYGLWVYADTSNRVIDTTAELTDMALTDQELDLLRNSFFGGNTFPASGAGVPDACGTTPSVRGFPTLFITAGQACYQAAWGGVAWATPVADVQLGGQWPGYPNYDVRPLEVNGQSLYLVGDQLIVRDARGTLLRQFGVGVSPYQSNPIARSENLVFVSSPDGYGTALQAYNIATQQLAWQLPVPGTVVGISNKGVLYVVAKFGPTIPDWRLVAINLLP